MTKEQFKKYLESDFSICPYCESKDIESNGFEWDYMGAEVHCTDCSKSWQDNYSISSVGFYTDPDKYEYDEYSIETGELAL